MAITSTSDTIDLHLIYSVTFPCKNKKLPNESDYLLIVIKCKIALNKDTSHDWINILTCRRCMRAFSRLGNRQIVC